MGLCSIARPRMGPSHCSHALWQWVHPSIWGALGTDISPCLSPSHPAPPRTLLLGPECPQSRLCPVTALVPAWSWHHPSMG